MTRDDIKKIIKEEGLRGYNFFEDRMDMENEIDALDNFLKRLRALNILRK